MHNQSFHAGMSEANPEATLWLPQLQNIWAYSSSSSSSSDSTQSVYSMFVLQLSMPAETVTNYGAPNAVYIQYEFSPDDAGKITALVLVRPFFVINDSFFDLAFDIALQWYEKTA